MQSLDTQDADTQTSSSRSRAAWAVVAPAVWLGLVWASTALAQEPVNPPEPTKPVFQWLFAIGITVVCVAIAFKNPRRSHLG